MKRRRNGPQIRKVQEKGRAVKKLQLSEHQGTGEEMQEGPGNLSGHREGPGGGGAPQGKRTSRGSKEEPPLTGVQTSLRKEPGRSCRKGHQEKIDEKKEPKLPKN